MLVDDDPLVRLALSHFVKRDPSLSIVAEAENGEEALVQIERHRPDVVMMDVQMPVMGGIEATSAITERWPEVKVLAVTTLDSRDTVLPMLNAGATGYMLKDSSAEEIVTALHQAYEGSSSLSPRVAAMLVKHVRETRPADGSELEALTERE
ncbi:MAG: response regulator transcription factor, partial [Leucobacter sp.]|nr:response regulator transcription factor [Leucobacter sp.]